MRPGRESWLWLLAVVLAAAAPAGRAAAAPAPVAVEGMRLGLGEADRFKVGTWTPVRVQLKGGAEAFEGTMDVVTPDDDGAETVLSWPIALPAGVTRWVSAYARPGTVGAEVIIRLRDARGRRVGQEFTSASLPSVEVLWSDQILLATLGQPSGVDAIAGLSGFSTPVEALGRSGPLVAVDPIRPTDGLPGRWYGFDAARAVIVDSNDARAMAALDGARGESLKTWVRNGGHLVVTVGASWQRVLDSSLAEMLPATPAGRIRLDDLGTLESFAGSTEPIPLDGNPAMVTRLEGWAERGGRPLDPTTSPLLVRGPYGFGRVTMIALDVDQRPFADWKDRGLFWVKAIDLRRPDDASAEAGPLGQPGSRAIYQTGATDLATLLRSSLDQFEGVRLIPFGWVAFFIFLYILAIGPGDYLLVRKVLKRMELTWITFPLIVGTVSLLAYLGAYAVKGTDLRVNKVDAIDVDQVAGLARGTTWLTVFSPANRDYDLSIAPRPLIGADPKAPAPKPAGAEVILSWFGVPETVFGGMNSSGRIGLTSTGYHYGSTDPRGPSDRPEALRGVRVPIWSTKSFTGHWTAPAPDVVVDSDLQAVGTDRLAGTVTNRLDRPLKDAALAFGSQVYFDLGTIEPGASVKVELKSNRKLAGYLDDLLGRSSGPNRPRADLVRVLMFRDSAGNRAAMLPSTALGSLDLTGQLALDRPILFAEIDGPAAALDLGGAEVARDRQTTVLRVILPLDRGEAR